MPPWDLDLDYLLNLIYTAINNIYGEFTISFGNYHFIDGTVLFFSFVIIKELIGLFWHHGDTESVYEDWFDDDDFDG